MSNHGDDPAFSPLHIGETAAPGLTKREYFAGQVLAGMIANPGPRPKNSGQSLIDSCVDIADALLAALDGKEQP